MNIIPLALEYYDKNTELYGDKFDNVKYYKIERFADESVFDAVIFLDAQKEVLFKSRFNIIGSYVPNLNLWKWAWSNPELKRKDTAIARKIINYGMELENNKSLHSELTTSKYHIQNSIQLDIHIAIASYLAKKPLVVKLYVYEKKDKKSDDLYLFQPVKEDLVNKLITHEEWDNLQIIYLVLTDYDAKD